MAARSKVCATRFVWIADILPDELAPVIDGMMEEGALAAKRCVVMRETAPYGAIRQPPSLVVERDKNLARAESIREGDDAGIAIEHRVEDEASGDALVDCAIISDGVPRIGGRCVDDQFLADRGHDCRASRAC
jgi:hypothetical protein